MGVMTPFELIIFSKGKWQNVEGGSSGLAGAEFTQTKEQSLPWLHGEEDNQRKPGFGMSQ